MTTYDQSWHAKYAEMTAESARRVLSHVVELFEPSSLLEVGCGLGHWTKEAIEVGVKDVVGVDGPWTSISELVIPRERFVVDDFERPLDLGRRFDLALTLEVAEHVDHASTTTFVESLVRHSDLVVFGAAIPLQGGYKHVNEQWPSYWTERFMSQRYRAFDILRPLFWNDDAIHYWYRQNMIVFIKEERSDLVKIAADEMHSIVDKVSPMNLVHPKSYELRTAQGKLGMRELLTQLPGAAWRAAEKRILKNPPS